MTILKPLNEELSTKTLPESSRIEDMHQYKFDEAPAKYELKTTGWKLVDEEPHIYVSYQNWQGKPTGDYFMLYRLGDRPYFVLDYGDEVVSEEFRVAIFLDGMISP